MGRNLKIDTVKKWLPLVLFYIYFLIVFSSFFLENALPGNTDTIYNLAIFKDYGNRLIALLTGESIGNALYPSKMMQQYAELYLGEAAIFLFYSVFTSSDVINYYLFIVTLYALNGWGMFLFANYLTRKTLPSLVAGLLFSSSSFAFSQIELLNGIPYFFFFLSLIYFLEYTKSITQKPYLLLWASVFAGIQFYFSNYIVLYLVVIMTAYLLFIKNKLLLIPNFYKHLFFAAIVGLIVILPYLIVADYGIPILNAHNPITLDLIPKFSLQLSDLWRHLPNHRFYNLPQNSISNETLRNINFGFLGFSFYLIFIAALYNLSFKTYKWWVLLGSLAFIIAMGPIIQWPSGEVKSIVYPLFYKTDLYKFMRIPARIYSLSIIAAIIIVSYFLSILSREKRIVLSIILVLLFYLENVPEKFHLFNAEIIKPPKELSHFFEKYDDKSEIIVAILPSSIFTGKRYNENGISEFSREYIYSYWQSLLKVNLVNGMCGFCPESRYTINHILSNNDVSRIKADFNVSHLVLLKNHIFKLDETEIFKEHNLIFKKKIVTPNLVIYEF
jgi:hypothetical protein